MTTQIYHLPGLTIEQSEIIHEMDAQAIKEGLWSTECLAFCDSKYLRIRNAAIVAFRKQTDRKYYPAKV